MSRTFEDGEIRQAGPESDDDVRCGRPADESAPGGRPRNLAPQEQEQDRRQLRKKKTRRRKPKRKNPYNKQTTEHRVHNKPNNNNTDRMYTALKQPVAPYNSNRFLIEDHNDLRDFDVELLAAANKPETRPAPDPARPPRLRDSSFTSADSDEDFFYSSPEDEEEFLTREFSNTYQDLHVESLTQMSKSELVQHVLQLEEKVDALEKRLDAVRVMRPERTTRDNEGGVDKIIMFQQEISTLVLANEELQHENEKLRRQKKRSSSTTSVDSESDSSTSSGSSGMSRNGSVTPHKLPNGTAPLPVDDCSMETDNAR